MAGLSDGLFIEVVEFQDFLCILADRNVAVAHDQADGAVLQFRRHIIEILDALGVAFRRDQDDLVFQQVYAAAALDEVQFIRIGFSIFRGVELVHLLLGCRNEEVAVGTVLDLRLQRSRRIEVKGNFYVRMFFLILGCNLVHRFRHAGCGKDRQMDFIAVPGSFVLFLVRPASGQGKSQCPGQYSSHYFFPRHQHASPSRNVN